MVFVELGGGQAIGLSPKSEHNIEIMVLATWFNNINPGYIPYSGSWAQWATHMTLRKMFHILESVKSMLVNYFLASKFNAGVDNSYEFQTRGTYVNQLVHLASLICSDKRGTGRDCTQSVNQTAWRKLAYFQYF